MSILHVTNGDSARVLLERSGLAGTFIAWPDILHEGPTPLLDGEEWIKVRSRYLVSGGYAPGGEAVDGMLSGYRARTAALESYPDYDEVVFWFEHDLFDQLLLMRHLWWLGATGARGATGAGAKGANGAGATRFSLVCGQEYLGLLMPDEFPPLFDARAPITAAQMELGTRAWRAFTSTDPMGLLPFAAEEHPELPYLAGGDSPAPRGVSVHGQRRRAQRTADPAGAVRGPADAGGSLRRGVAPRGSHLHGGCQLLDDRAALVGGAAAVGRRRGAAARGSLAVGNARADCGRRGGTRRPRRPGRPQRDRSLARRRAAYF